MNQFFTSDHHFGHTNVIKFCNRPFKDVQEMNEVLIERWNEKIKPEDEVYYLGDFALTKHKGMVRDILDRLHGKIYLIEGNHERSALHYRDRFEWVKDYHELKVKDEDAPYGVRRMILFHYAMRVWKGDFRQSWHLYGHTHNSLPDKPHKLAFDVGVDCHDYYPLSYDEVKAIMAKKKWVDPFGE